MELGMGVHQVMEILPSFHFPFDSIEFGTVTGEFANFMQLQGLPTYLPSYFRVS